MRIERVAFYLTAVFVCVLLGSAYFLPMSDLPHHAGQVEVLKSIIVGDSIESWFSEIRINYFTSYWICYFSTLILAFFLPVNYAINVIVGIAFFLFVLSFSTLRKRFKAPSILDWILLPSFFSFAYSWGFITFILAIPVGVLLVIQNLKLLDIRNNKQIIKVILIGVLLYFSHMLVFLFFCLIASCMTIVDRRFTINEKIKYLLPFYILFLLIPLFFLVGSDFFSTNEIGKYLGENYSGFRYGSFGTRVVRLLKFPWAINDGLHILSSISIFVLGLPFLIGYRLSNDPKKIVPFIVFFVLWFALPREAARTAYIYHRFSMFFFPFYILMFEKNAVEGTAQEVKQQFIFSYIWIFASLALLLFPVKELINFKKETEGFKLLLTKVPERKRALSLVYDASHNSERGGHIYLSFPTWYQALKHGWVDFNVAWFPPQVVRYKIEAIPEAESKFSWKPEIFYTFKNCNYYDLIFVRVASKSQLQQHEDLMKKSTCSHKLFYQNGLWSVYSL